MSNYELKNARIESTRLGFGNDHGFLDHMIILDYGGTSQGYGGYVLGYQSGNKPVGGEIAGDTIIGILRVVGADDWEQLRGKSVRAVQSHSNVAAIGHYLRDQWFWIADGAAHVGTYDEMLASGVTKG